MASCNERTKSGKRCRAKPMANGKCAIHQNPDRAKELAKRSIESRRRAAAVAHAAVEILAPKTAEDLVGQLGQVLADLRNGRVDVGVARTMASVGQVFLKGLELTDAKKQLNRIEELVRERYCRRGESQGTGQENYDS